MVCHETYKDKNNNWVSPDELNTIDGKKFLKSTGESVKVKINGNDGKFTAIIKIEEEQDVMVTVKKPGNSFDTKLIKAETLTEMVKEEKTYMQGSLYKAYS